MSERSLGTRLWLVLLFACAAAAIPFLFAGFSFEPAYLRSFFLWPAIGFGAISFLKRYPFTYAFAGAVEGIFLLGFAALFGLLVCYAAAAGGAPLVDRQLLSIDQWLGYDWDHYARFCAAHPGLLQTFRYAYNSNLTQPALIAALLHLTRQEVRFEKFLLANVVGVLITALIFLFLPATTAWTLQGQEAYASHLLHDLPISTDSWLGDLLQIRNGGGRSISRLAGIVAFPSFHCVSAILNLWAVWRIGWLRLPFALLNAIMLAATPIIGGHYLSDILGGFVVTAATLAAVGPLHAYLRDLKLWDAMGARMPRLPGLAG